uniref:Uncharacterized protein n=1 Tax=Salix viminalis TaxID=40686 RepID=A0A6N2L6R2_SALVM
MCQLILSSPFQVSSNIPLAHAIPAASAVRVGNFWFQDLLPATPASLIFNRTRAAITASPEVAVEAPPHNSSAVFSNVINISLHSSHDSSSCHLLCTWKRLFNRPVAAEFLPNRKQQRILGFLMVFIQGSISKN